MERCLHIDPRFNGPPSSGNGGYVCGAMALSSPGIGRVRLYAPPPLATDLRLVPTDEGVGLFDGETLIGEGWPDRLQLEPPPAPGFEEAAEASRAFRGFVEHPLPTCFVCGPDRAEGDGLRLFPGPLADGRVFAAPWIPDASLALARRSGADESSLPAPARAGSEVDPIFVWSALDCPGCFSFPQPPGALVLLGELSARIDGPVHVGERHVVASWSMEHSGRRHITGTALYDERGRCLGLARAIWIEVSPDRPDRAGSAA